MGPGYRGVMIGPPITESSSEKHVNINTQNEVSETNLIASRLEKSNHGIGPATPGPIEWGDDHAEMPSNTGPCSSDLQEKATCVDGSKRNTAASLIPADNAGTISGCSDALAPPNKECPSVFPNGEVHASSPVSKSNESLSATATVVATKLSSRKGDKGPP